MMGERYWITGVQLGMLLAYDKDNFPNLVREVVEDIEKNQFIGRVDSDQDVIIVKHIKLGDKNE